MEAPPAERVRILVVDDEPLVEHALAEALRQAGHDVTAVPDGARGLELLLSSTPFDLVFCDLMMRGMTGMALAAILRERAPHRLEHIVYMSGGAFTPEAKSFQEAHAAQSVDKPFDIVQETRSRMQARRKA